MTLIANVGAQHAVSGWSRLGMPASLTLDDTPAFDTGALDGIGTSGTVR